jgi:hypothetical protein
MGAHTVRGYLMAIYGEFMSTNYDESFMELKTHYQRRKVDDDPVTSQGVISHTN